jgi:hypothetical protein
MVEVIPVPVHTGRSDYAWCMLLTRHDPGAATLSRRTVDVVRPGLRGAVGERNVASTRAAMSAPPLAVCDHDVFAFAPLAGVASTTRICEHMFGSGDNRSIARGRVLPPGRASGGRTA